MKTAIFLATGLLLGGILALAASPVGATTTYLTNFTKTDDIYTNLNEQFPNTGPGLPGSGVGVPNATYLFTPPATGQGNPNNLNDANNGVSFELASDAAGKDFAEIGSAGFGVGP